MIPHMPQEKNISQKQSKSQPKAASRSPSRKPPPPTALEKQQTVADLNEVENYNNGPQEKLGGKMSLNDLKNTNVDSKTIKDLVSKALTIKALKELEKIPDSDEERVDYDIRRETIRPARTMNKTAAENSLDPTD